jgi:hypothetical protein
VVWLCSPAAAKEKGAFRRFSILRRSPRPEHDPYKCGAIFQVIMFNNGLKRDPPVDLNSSPSGVAYPTIRRAF